MATPMIRIPEETEIFSISEFVMPAPELSAGVPQVQLVMVLQLAIQRACLIYEEQNNSSDP